MSDPILHLSIAVSDLAEARRFYEEAFGCRLGRVRDDWLDVWFFGMQLTLQERPGEVVGPNDDVRHFGVVLQDAATYALLIEGLRSHQVRWVSEPSTYEEAGLSGKSAGKLADPSGNVIEIKYYEDLWEFFGQNM